jgi:hypothetical protein
MDSGTDERGARFDPPVQQPIVDRIQALLEEKGKSLDDYLDVCSRVARRLGHSPRQAKNVADRIRMFITAKKGVYRPTIDVISEALDVFEGKSQIESIGSGRQASLAKSSQWFDIRIREHSKDLLEDAYERLNGRFSCFYRARERKEEGQEYIERVRYEILSADNNHFQGRYTTAFSAEFPGQEKTLLMIMSKNERRVLSAIHFPGGNHKTIAYSLVRTVVTFDGRTVLYGITVREGRVQGTIAAFKTIWFPEANLGQLGDKYVFYKDDVEKECWDFLERFFKHTELREGGGRVERMPDHFFLEFRGGYHIQELIDAYVKECGNRPLMRLRSGQMVAPADATAPSA